MTTGHDLTNQEKLEEIFEMTKENNDILRSLRRQQHVANAFRFLYWIVILVSLGGIYYYVRPMLDTFNNNKEALEASMQELDTFRSQFPNVKQFLENFRNSGSSTSTGN